MLPADDEMEKGVPEHFKYAHGQQGPTPISLESLPSNNPVALVASKGEPKVIEAFPQIEKLFSSGWFPI